MKNNARWLNYLLCILMVFSFAGCVGKEEDEPDNKEKVVDDKEDDDVPEFSDEYLLGIDFGGGSWGEFYDCIGATVVVCRNRDVLIFMATKVEGNQVVDTGLIATLSLSEEQYDNIENGVKLNKLYTLDPKPDRSVCDGYSEYIYLYDEDEEVAKACGGYMPSNNYFIKSYKLILENLPEDEIYEIVDEQREELRVADTDAGYDENQVYNYYSDDNSVYIRQDYNTFESFVVDGDLEIPVDIAMGVYGPKIAKTDIDGDGQDEYVISECEGTGTGFSVYGLCVLNETDGGYDLIKYEGDYFAGVVEGKIVYTYDPDMHEVTFEVKNSDTPAVSVILERDADLETIVWSDIISIELVEGMPVLSVPSGYVFDDSPVPDYEQAVEVSAPIIISDTGSIDFGEFTLSAD